MNKTLRHLTPPPGIILLLCLLVSLAIQARAQAAPSLSLIIKHSYRHELAFVARLAVLLLKSFDP